MGDGADVAGVANAQDCEAPAPAMARERSGGRPQNELIPTQDELDRAAAAAPAAAAEATAAAVAAAEDSLASNARPNKRGLVCDADELREPNEAAGRLRRFKPPLPVSGFTVDQSSASPFSSFSAAASPFASFASAASKTHPDPVKPGSDQDRDDKRPSPADDDNDDDNDDDDKQVQHSAAAKLNQDDTKPDSGFENLLKNSHPTKGTDADERVPSPAVQLEEQHVSTGEEDEKTVFSTKAKLYLIDQDTKSWKERGLGTLKVLVSKTESKKPNNSRIGLQVEGANAESESNDAPRSQNKFIRLSVFEKGELVHIAIKVSTTQAAQLLADKIREAIPAV